MASLLLQRARQAPPTGGGAQPPSSGGRAPPRPAAVGGSRPPLRPSAVQAAGRAVANPGVTPYVRPPPLVGGAGPQGGGPLPLPGTLNGASSVLTGGRSATGLVAAVPIAPVVQSIVDNAAQRVNPKQRQEMAALTIAAANQMPQLDIIGTRFAFFNYRQLLQLAVAEINVPLTEGRNTPMDTRLGVLNDSELCRTCNKTNIECPGHYGYIKLNRWYLDPTVAQYAIRVLQCVCKSCSRIKVNEETLRRNGVMSIRDLAERLRIIAEISVKLGCTRHQDQRAPTGHAAPPIPAGTDIPALTGRAAAAQASSAVPPSTARTAPTQLGEAGATRRRCPPNPKYAPEQMRGNNNYIVCCEYSDRAMGKNQIELSIPEIDNIFRQIPDEDLRLLGFAVAKAPGAGLINPVTGMREETAHPQDWIIKAFPVTPPHARPYIFQDGELRHDHLTTAYCDIIRTNNRLGEVASVPIDPQCPPRPILRTGGNAENEKRKLERNLFRYISHFINNRDGQYFRCPEEPINSVEQRIIDKTGIIRGLSMGKRVDMCGRTVLGPGNFLPFGYVGYPRRMQRILTSAIVVTRANLAEMQQLYREGKITSITPGTGPYLGVRIRIMAHNRDKFNPDVGDTVDRWSQNGDETLFGRQPTLHKEGFMGHFAWYAEDEEDDTDTFRLCSAYTTPYNADFDGDEGNKHKLQTLDARAEARTFANVQDCIMSAQTNRPNMGMVYNPLSSAYMLCDDNVVFDDDDWAEAMTFLQSHVGLQTLVARLRKNGVAPQTGRALFSALLPEDFYYNGGDGIRIRDGVLCVPPPPPDDAKPHYGRLTKKHIGPAAGSIIQHLHKQYPKTRVVRFFTECQYILDWFIEWKGLSIGYSSCIAPNAEAVRNVIATELDSARIQIAALGPETAETTELEKDFREKQVQSILNNTTRIGRVIGTKLLAPNNPLNIMANSGAKGNESNTAQIVGLLGQQYIKGQRPALMLMNGRRALPYFEPDSRDIEAQGYIPQNFMTGLDPAGVMFHMSASRIGLIDTAVNTAQTGAQHHRLVKTLEDICVGYDGSIRNVNMTAVLQFVAGGDGFNAKHLQMVKSPLTGDYCSFVDLSSAIGKLNHKYGF